MKQTKEHFCEIKSEDHLYRIGMFAQMNHITIKALRFYEEQGLFAPASIDEESGYRYYTMSQMESLHRILALKEAGFTIDDIKRLNSSGDEKAFLRKKRRELVEKIAELTTHLAHIDSYIDSSDDSLTSPILVKTIPSVICAVCERTINTYDELFDLMPQMGMLMEEAGCKCATPEYCFTCYPEPGYKDVNVRIQTCEAVTQAVNNANGLEFVTFPEITAASIFHKGSYNNFPKTYAMILKYIEDNEYVISGPIRENYIDGVWNKDREEDWLSEIQIPVEKRTLS